MIEKTRYNDIELIAFGNESKEERKLLKKFVDFHWKLYKKDPQFVPLLDYEYLGFKLINITGFFEPRNLFFKHAVMRFFMAVKDGKNLDGSSNRIPERSGHGYNTRPTESSGK